MLHRQRGVLNLYWVAIFSAVFAGLAMAALFSMRYERKLFAEGAAKISQLFNSSPAAQMVDSAKGAAGGNDGALRKCVIDGKTVISNSDCKDSNPTSKKLDIQDTKGFEAPKAPPKVEKAPTSQPALDKMIEKQLH